MKISKSAAIIARSFAAVCVGFVFLAFASFTAGAEDTGPLADGDLALGASQTGERIRAFNVDVEIQESGRAVVKETIDYDFGTNRRRGIFRYVPVRYPALTEEVEAQLGEEVPDGASYERITPLDVISVESRTANDKVEEIHEGGYTKLRIGDEDKFFSGRHTYVITYSIEGVLNGFESYDEFFWNTTGNEWPVPIDKASATVTVPGSIQRVKCFSGSYGSDAPCDSSSKSDSTANFTASNLTSNSGLSIAVAVPKGVFSNTDPIFDEVWSINRAFDRSPAKVGAVLAGLGVAAGGVGLLGFRVGRDRRYIGSVTDQAFGNQSGEEERIGLGERQEGPVEYTPPDGILPGQLGTLVDEVAHSLDVTATIVDLAVRGYMQIEEVDSWGSDQSYKSEDYKLVKLREADDGLHKYEARLLGHLFSTGDERKLSSIKQNFHAQLGEIQDDLYKDAVKQGWFHRRPDKVRGRWAGIGFGIMILGVAITVLLAIWTSWALFGLVFPLVGVAIMVLSHKMPYRTGRGSGMYSRILGFRELFEAGEGERQRWIEEQNIFSKYLPYAMVFGLTDKWAKTFEALAAEGVIPGDDMGWWVSTRPFGYTHFSRRLDDFSTVTTGSLSAVKPTTASGGGSAFGGGFGGGGFSGGGFGGGGGGSW